MVTNLLITKKYKKQRRERKYGENIYTESLPQAVCVKMHAMRGGENIRETSETFRDGLRLVE